MSRLFFFLSVDINECEQRDMCQHECINTPGSHKCLCPNGYRLMTNGKTCQGKKKKKKTFSSDAVVVFLSETGDFITFSLLCLDVDECLEQNIQCGVNRMCFNMRGSYQCIDTPCPPNYQRDPESG